MWQARERFGVMPLQGGWMSQPLPLLVQIDAIDLVHKTWMYKNSKGYQMSKLTPTQADIILSIEGAM